MHRESVSVISGPFMLSNYVTTALRSLRQHLGYATINVVGLGVGIAVSALLLLFVRSEMAVNDVFPNAERIYRVDSWQTEGTPGPRQISTAPVGETLEREVPGVDGRTWVYGMFVTLGTENEYHRRDSFLTNADFFEVFDLPLLRGDAETALDEPRSIVLREDIARTIFGTTDVVGRTVNVNTYRNGQQPYTVTGVWDELPNNTVTQFRSNQFKMLLRQGGSQDFVAEAAFQQWRASFLVQFVRLDEQTDVADVRRRADRIPQDAPEEVRGTFAVDLNPLTEVYLTDADNAGWQRIYLVGALAALVLLIAGINFTNLATARSLDRTREIGVRKTLGAQRGQLARQFLVEAVLVSAAATVLGAVLAAAAMPVFERVSGVEFVLSTPWDAWTLGVLAVLAVLVGLLSGAYPAVVMSGFQPIAVLRDRLSLGWSAGAIRKGLVVVQFALAIVLMAGVYVVNEQIEMATSPDAPYPADRMLVVESLPRDFSEAGFRRVQTARNRIAGQSEVEAASASTDWPEVVTEASSGSGQPLRRPEWPDERRVEAAPYGVDPHFADTYDLTVTQGHFFREPVADDTTNVVLNEKAAEQLNLDQPAGAEIEWGETTVTVIGVVENFNLQNAHTGIRPVALYAVQPGEWTRVMSARLTSGGRSAVQAVRSVWEETFPDAPFVYTFLDDRIRDGYAAERRTRRLVGAGAGLALFVALLGLLGLTGFTVRRRTKEIGIRKALGASVASVVRLLSSDVAKLVGAAFLVGGPLAYALARWWLQDFAMRIDLTPWPFLGVGLAAMLCALAVVSVHTIRAARIDPATTLREE
jgi:putative ABC transport system permease protein